MIDLDILEGSLEDFEKDDNWIDLRLMIVKAIRICLEFDRQ